MSTGAHRARSAPWWLVAGVRVWMGVKVALLVGGVLFYLLLIAVVV